MPIVVGARNVSKSVTGIRVGESATSRTYAGTNRGIKCEEKQAWRE